MVETINFQRRSNEVVLPFIDNEADYKQYVEVNSESIKSIKRVLLSPSKIIALGLNYMDHINESDKINVQNFTHEVPSEPILFPKTPNVLIGPGETIVIPKFIYDYDWKHEVRTDYEGELALVIKKRAKNISPENVDDYILGYTCFNDVSQRNMQRNDKSGWFRGKSLDTFGPIGPAVISPELIPDPQNLSIKTRLNGEVVQDSNTKHMLFKINEIVSFVSKNFTLEPGDIISTGTPSGVGPLSDGDVVEVEIEKIGILKNKVRVE